MELVEELKQTPNDGADESSRNVTNGTEIAGHIEYSRSKIRISGLFFLLIHFVTRHHEK